MRTTAPAALAATLALLMTGCTYASEQLGQGTSGGSDSSQDAAAQGYDTSTI